MNWDTIEGNWKQFRGQVKQKWGELTDDDLDVIQADGTHRPHPGTVRQDP